MTLDKVSHLVVPALRWLGEDVLKHIAAASYSRPSPYERDHTGARPPRGLFSREGQAK